MQEFKDIDFSFTERIVSGDVEAFDEVFRRCYPSLLAYASQIVDARDAEDVVQDVFVWIWSHRNYLPTALGGSALRYYLLKSVYNGCLNKKRRTDVDSTSREWFSRRMEQAYTSYNPDNDPVIRKLYSEELGFILNDAIETLPKRCREVFILSHIEGISNKRIAEILGISLSTVENHIYNALKSLRNKLK